MSSPTTPRPPAAVPVVDDATWDIGIADLSTCPACGEDLEFDLEMQCVQRAEYLKERGTARCQCDACGAILRVSRLTVVRIVEPSRHAVDDGDSDA